MHKLAYFEGGHNIMIKVSLLISTVVLVSIFFSFQSKALEKRATFEMGFKPCKISAKKLSTMPLKGDKTIYPRDISVVIDDPNSIPRNNGVENENSTPDPVEETSLKKLLENLDNENSKDPINSKIALIDVDGNGFCDLFISSPYETASLYLSDSKGSLINKKINSLIPLGDLSFTPVYFDNTNTPYILSQSSNHWESETAVWSWDKINKKPIVIDSRFVSEVDNKHETAILEYFYEKKISDAIKYLRDGDFSKANSFLSEARQFDNGKDYKRHYYKGIISSLRKKYKSAEIYFLTALKRTISSDKEKALVFYNLGLTQKSLNKQKESLESFKKYLAISPDGQYAESVKKIISSF